MVKVTYKDFGLARVLKSVERLGVERVLVGLVGPKAAEPSADGRSTIAQVGLINEYGSDDKKTVPERSFLREPFRRARATVVGLMRRVATRVVRLEETPEEATDWLGGELAQIVRHAILEYIGPANADATIKKKGFDHPLVMTAALVEAISHRAVRASGEVLEAGSAVGDYEAYQVGE